MMKRAQHAPVAALRVHELREERANRQTVHVAGVDAGQERLGQKRGRFAAETPRHERTNRLVRIFAARWDQQLRAHAYLATPREESRAEDRTDARRHTEDRSRRQRMELPVAL